MLVRRWVAIWKTRKVAAFLVLGIVLVMLLVQHFAGQVVVISDVPGEREEKKNVLFFFFFFTPFCDVLSEGGQMRKSYRGESPLLCAAFVAERGHASSLVALMTTVFSKFRHARKGDWEAIVVAMSSSSRAVETIKKRFAIDLFVGSKVSRGADWPVLTAVMGGCRAPFVLLVRQEASLSALPELDSAKALRGKLQKDRKAAGVYLEPSGVTCSSSGECPINKEYTGALFLDRTKLVEAFPAYLEEEHTMADLIEKAGMHMLEDVK